MLSLCRRLTRHQHILIRQLSSIATTNDHNGITNDMEYDLITTAQQGREWMKQIRDRVRGSKYFPESAHWTPSEHYAERLSEVDDTIWFGVDTEFVEKQCILFDALFHKSSLIPFEFGYAF